MKTILLAAAAALTVPAAAGAATLTLEKIRTGRPVTDIVSSGDGDRRGYVLSLGNGAEPSGRIDIYDPDRGAFAATPFLDAVPDSAQAFSLAFAPDHALSGAAYVSYRTPDRRHKVVRYTRLAGEDRLDPLSAEVIVTVDHSDGAARGTHYGADIAFGPDGMLYVTTGDSDRPVTGVSVSQDPRDPRGAVLRIDPSRDDLPADPGNNFGLPADNPDFGPDAAPGLWAVGLRNPFKADWDAATGRYLVADVGEDDWEEVVLGAAGANYGWSAFEGPAAGPGALPPGGAAGALAGPLYAYRHGGDPLEGYSITGGVVVRGGLAALEGQYVFGDFGGFGVPVFTGGRVFSFAADAAAGDLPGGVTAYRILYPASALNPTGDGLDRVLSFGQDGAGNLYVADFADGDLFRVAAARMGVVPLPASAWLLALALGGLAGAARRRGPAAAGSGRR